MASIAEAISAGRPVQYLRSAGTSKEEIARRIAKEQQITQGTVCILISVQPCNSFEVYRNKEEKRLQLVSRFRKCLHIYHYLIHPTFGFMNARIQTWFPFHIQIAINGREWLSRQMDKAGIKYRKQGNCFVWIEDYEQAQILLNQQLETNWTDLLTFTTGITNYVDAAASKFPGRFYRVVSP